EARLSATGNWATQEAPHGAGTAVQRRTALNFRLDIDDSGQLLTRLGREGVVRGGKGRMEGRIGWLGSPLALDYPSLSGQLQLEIERGQFLKVDPGAAKLLGVLSLQALPRRLVLDFRDVFSEGFAFDFVRGDARIDQGVVFTNNLQMKGINAAVLMEGTADLAREQQDLKVVVVPEINAGTASLIASAINPAVGLGSFLAQFLLRQPLQSAATQEFHITGGWADPQIEKIQRVPPAGPEPKQ
ncbi:MAG: AsmA-like C-terminal region-containing protein, partial [Hydrogenophaga sp.]|nr:AsmA-like C-terminal region-containing protein [Hydrogenophaga sp.]